MLAGNDLAHMPAETLEILTAPELLAVNQDALGVQGHVCARTAGNTTQVWTKMLADGSTALLLLNRDDHDTHNVTADFKACLAKRPTMARPRPVGAEGPRHVHGQHPAVLAPHQSAVYKATPTTSLRSGPGGDYCYATQRNNARAVLRCPTGTRIARIAFASFGGPTGSCGAFAADHACASATAGDAIARLCVGLARCKFDATEELLGTVGAACDTRRLAVQYECA